MERQLESSFELEEPMTYSPTGASESITSTMGMLGFTNTRRKKEVTVEEKAKSDETKGQVHRLIWRRSFSKDGALDFNKYLRRRL